MRRWVWLSLGLCLGGCFEGEEPASVEDGALLTPPRIVDAGPPPPLMEGGAACPIVEFPEHPLKAGPVIWNRGQLLMSWFPYYISVGGNILELERSGGIEAYSKEGRLIWSRIFEGQISTPWVENGEVRIATLTPRNIEISTLNDQGDLSNIKAFVYEGKDLDNIYNYRFEVKPINGSYWTLSLFNEVFKLKDGIAHRYSDRFREILTEDEVLFYRSSSSVEDGVFFAIYAASNRDARTFRYFLVKFDEDDVNFTPFNLPGFSPYAMRTSGDRVYLLGAQLDGDNRWKGRLITLDRELHPLEAHDYDFIGDCRHDGAMQKLLYLDPRERGWFALGEACNLGDEGDIWLMGLDASGAAEWQARLNRDRDDDLISAARSADGTLALSATLQECCYDSGGPRGAYLMFVDPAGACLRGEPEPSQSSEQPR